MCLEQVANISLHGKGVVEQQGNVILRVSEQDSLLVRLDVCHDDAAPVRTICPLSLALRFSTSKAFTVNGMGVELAWDDVK